MAGALRTFTCKGCGGPRDKGSRTGLCRTCWTPKREPRFCGCGARLGRQNKGGLCRLCVCRRNGTDPVLSAKRRAATLASNADPMLRQKRAEACRKACRTPEERARRSALGKLTYTRTIHSPKAKANSWTEKAVAMRAAARRATFEARRARRIAEAEAVKQARVARELREAAQAHLTPFERAMERIRQGAGIIEVRPISKAEPAFTLGGVSSI